MAYEKKFGYSGKNDLTPKQWAWEFLRRNTDYREAYKKIHSLSEADLKALIAVRDKGFESIQGVSQFPVNWFAINYIPDPIDDEGLVEAWLNQLERYYKHQPEKRTDIPEVSLEKKLLPTTYSLAIWIDPEISPLPKKDFHKLGVLAVDSIDWFKRKKLGKKETVYKSDKHGVPWMWRRSERSRPSSVSYTMQGTKGASGAMFELFPIDGSTLGVATNTQMVLRVDLNFPLRPQLDLLTQKIEDLQGILEKEKLCYSFPKRADKAGIYKEYIAILDLLAAGKSPVEIAQKLRGKSTIKGTHYIDKKAVSYLKILDSVGQEITPLCPITRDMRKKIERALELRDFGYLGLAFMS